MGYKNENLKHRQGIKQPSKYKCPNCKKPLSIKEIPFMIICSKCKKPFKGEDVIINS